MMSQKRDVSQHDASGASPAKSRRIDPMACSCSFVQAIMDDNKFQVIDSDGIHVAMKNMPNPYTLHTSDVVIRDDDHAFWKACITELEDTKKRNRVAIVGTPGIGKTTTSYFAIRMLLKMGKTVVYLYRTEDKSNKYIQMTPEPGSNNVNIELFPESTSATNIPALQEKENYYVVDPGQTKQNCNPEGGVMAKVIIVASPDERHWGTAFGKKEPGRDPGMFRYFPPWSILQLKKSAGYIHSVSISAGEIEELFTLFGGIPRLIYDPDEKDENMATLERKVNDLDLAEMKKLLSGRGNIHVGFGQDQPKGGIIIFKPSDNFVKVDLEAASDKVLELIREVYMDTAVWDDLATYGSPIAWQLLESYVSESLQGTKDYVTRPCVGKSDDHYSQEDTANIGGCTSRSFQSDCTAAVRDGDDRVLYYSSNRFHPLYDVIFKIDDVYFAFQVTIGKKHKATKSEIVKVVASLGITSGGPELRLFYAVHEGVFDGFVTDPTVPFAPPGVSIHHLKIGRRD